MKLEVGMYVRTDKGYIGEITHCRENAEMVSTDIDKEYLDVDYGYGISFREITKASHNIIDLIEVGDYVDGEKVIRTNCNVLYYDEDSGNEIDIYNALETTDSWVYFDSEITSIVTKEQFEAMVYKIMN